MASLNVPRKPKHRRPFWEPEAGEDQNPLLAAIRRREGVITLSLVLSAFIITIIFCVAFFTVDKLEEQEAMAQALAVAANGNISLTSSAPPLNRTGH